jgi:aryl-alcohol dehydrogenase-like predicted oxidoreductase
MMFGGQTDEKESLKIMDYAYEHGINFFDTANVYNQGEARGLSGRIKGQTRRDYPCTKVCGQMGDNPNNAGLSRRNILSAVDASLRRLILIISIFTICIVRTTKPRWKKPWRRCPPW